MHLLAQFSAQKLAHPIRQIRILVMDRYHFYEHIPVAESIVVHKLLYLAESCCH